VRPSRGWGVFFTALFVASMLALVALMCALLVWVLGLVAAVIAGLPFVAFVGGLLWWVWPRSQGPGGEPNA
jgi:hypothetical protein